MFDDLNLQELNLLREGIFVAKDSLEKHQQSFPWEHHTGAPAVIEEYEKMLETITRRIREWQE